MTCCCCVVAQVTVRAQEKSEEVSSGLPFLADLALALSVLGCTMLHLLYQGPATSQDEQRCAHLLKSRLLQRCVWQLDSTDVTATGIPVAWAAADEDTLAPPSPSHKVSHIHVSMYACRV